MMAAGEALDAFIFGAAVTFMLEGGFVSGIWLELSKVALLAVIYAIAKMLTMRILRVVPYQNLW